MVIRFHSDHVVLANLLDDQPYLLWSEGINIIFVLNGTVHVLFNGQQETLEKAGLLLINPLELCQVTCSTDSRAIALQIPKECLKIAGVAQGKEKFRCCAKDQQSHPQTIFDELRRELAKVVSLYFNQGTKQELYPSFLKILQFIQYNFQAPSDAAQNHVSQTSIVRLNDVLQYLHQHWQENLSVAQLAAQVYVSPNYLSRFFNKYLGTTITEYLLNLRMQAAVELLENDPGSITEIAMKTGFPSATTFIRTFKQRYGMTPKRYQKEQKSKAKDSRNRIYSFVDTKAENDLSTLLDYLPQQDEPDEMGEGVRTRRHLTVDIRKTVKPLRHTWRKLLNFGYAREGLLAAVQQQISQAQREIGFEYIRFHGIFDDNMQFYHEDEEGNPKLNFLYVDLLLDFLVGQGFKLYIELGLMPKALKKYDIFILNRDSNYSVAADPDKWRTVVMQSIEHWIARYGRERVKTWRFTTIGIHVPVFTSITFEEFYQHYLTSYQAVKAVEPALQFGGPGGFASIVWDHSILLDFFQFAKRSDCFPDFITTQNYPHQNMESDTDFMNISVSQDFLPTTLSGDRHFTRHLLQRIHQVLEQAGEPALPIWMEEWNSTIWQRDLSSETCYKSAWLTKDITENYDQAEAFGYWLLTDFVEERGAFDRMFHGGYGLFTYNGVPKSGWTALGLLRKMGSEQLCSGEWYFVTRSARQIQVLLFHYCDYDNLYRYRYRKLESPEEAYRVFRKSKTIQAEICLQGIAQRPYRLHRFGIGREQGSSFDQWLRWGAPTELNQMALEQLQLAAAPEYRSEQVCPDERGNYTIQTELRPHEVQLFVMELI